MRWLWVVLMVYGLTQGAEVVAEPLYQFGFNIRARMRVDANRDANVALYSHFGEYSSVHVELHDERGWSLIFAQKLQNFDKLVDSEQVERAFLTYASQGRRVQVGKMWLPFGMGLGERELLKGALFTFPTQGGGALQVGGFDNGKGRQRGLFYRLHSRSVGMSVAVGQNLGISKTAFRFVRGEDYEPQLGRGYGLLAGIDARRVVGTTTWQAELIVARNGMLPSTEFLLVQVSSRLPAGLFTVFRADVDRQKREIRWQIAVQQNLLGEVSLYPQIVFRRADFEAANLELRLSF